MSREVRYAGPRLRGQFSHPGSAGAPARSTAATPQPPKKPPIEGKRLEGEDDVMKGRDYVASTTPGEPGLYYRKDLPPGTFSWAGRCVDLDEEERDVRYLNFVCPCGCGVVSSISVREGKKVEDSWQWNGDLERPVIRPSIFKKFGCRWHGYLGGLPPGEKPGIWETC